MNDNELFLEIGWDDLFVRLGLERGLCCWLACVWFRSSASPSVERRMGMVSSYLYRFLCERAPSCGVARFLCVSKL